MAGEGGQQRRVLARVVRAGRRRVAAVVGGEDEQVAAGIQALEPARHRAVDGPQGAVEARRVVAVAVDLVRLDEVDEREPVLEPVHQGIRRGDRLGVGRRRVLAADPHPGEHLPDLADRVDGHAGVAELLEVGAPGRVDGEVATPGRPLEGARLARERAGDHPADGVLARHDPPGGGARGVELLPRDDGLVRRDLEDRVGRRVDDQVPGAQVLGAEVVDRPDAVVGGVAEHAAPRRRLERGDDLGREAAGIGPHRLRRDDAHQLPVTRRRVLSRPERVQPAVEDRVGGGRDAPERQRGAEPERAHRREVEPADRVGEVAERVRARVAVVGRVGQRPRPAGVEDDHEGAPAGHQLAGARSRRVASAGRKTLASRRSKSAGGA